MSSNVPKQINKLRKAARRRKVIQLKADGYLIEDIAKQLNVSEKTVDRDLASQDTQQFTNELIRQQILDIKQSKPAIRLHYRSDLLDKLLPKKLEQKIEGAESFRVEIVDNSKITKSESNDVSSTSSTT